MQQKVVALRSRGYDRIQKTGFQKWYKQETSLVIAIIRIFLLGFIPGWNSGSVIDPYMEHIVVAAVLVLTWSADMWKLSVMLECI